VRQAPSAGPDHPGAVDYSGEFGLYFKCNSEAAEVESQEVIDLIFVL
jgi:hypothetical protein